jgi:hypothetical protein
MEALFLKYKLGKQPFKEDERDIHLKTLLNREKLPTAPASTNDYSLIKIWLMLLNNIIGCCAVAGPYHLLMLWCKQAGKVLKITDENIKFVYSKISGYDPTDPTSDVGCVLRDVLKYWKNVGIPDANGVLHKIAAFARLNQLDHEEIKLAQYLFSGILIGFQVPKYAMDQFDKGMIWDVQLQNNEIIGGHCVAPTGYGKCKPTGNVVKIIKEGLFVVTWGKVQFMTWAFWDKSVDEAWVIFDKEMLKNDLSPDGFDSNKLVNYLNQLAEA